MVKKKTPGKKKTLLFDFNKPNKGKPKLSKAEKEKLKREEAERKAEEEEQARLAAIEEEKKRKELEKQEASERKKLENAQRKIRKTQMSDLDELLQINKMALKDKHDLRRKQEKWARYLRCDGSPDPTVPWEINTYINLKMEEASRNDADSVLTDSEMDLKLIDELQYMLDDTPPDEITERELAASKETIEELQNLVKTKLDLATLQVLCDATSLQDSETNNLQYCKDNSAICLCVWGNLSKNQRIKTYEFSNKGFTFDIPRTLALTNCAIRVLFTKFDHWSPQCKAFLPRPKIKEPEVPEVVVEEEVKEEVPEETESPGEEGEQQEEQEAEVEKDNTMDLLSQLQNFGKEEEEKPEEEETKEEEVEEEEEDYEDRVTPEPVEWLDFDEFDDVLDLRAFHVIGEIITFNLLELPPQPKTVNKWTITTLVDPPELNYLEYKAEPAAANQTKDQKDSHTQEKRDEKPPVGIHIKLPTNQVYLEEPQITWWDDKHKLWRLNGFSDIVYNEEKRTLDFKTSRFGTLALLQDAHINMPFQSWEIRPRGLNRAVLTIVAAIVEIEIEIEDSTCCLSKSTELPELAPLKNIPMIPRDFIKALQKVGMNIFPAPDSSKYVTIQDKHLVVEERIYEEMALVASSMAFSWSKWNSEVNDKQKIIFQTAEHLSDERLLEEDWSLFQATKRQVMKLKMNEFDEQYVEESAVTEYHSNMYHLVTYTGSEEAVDRIKSSSIEFIDCVEQILKATKVLTYA
ncbi:axonemal 84 kDa protein-like [Gigantopelta aegis]|uniref:axonemal 84 kDa protein-like n=1 Tax=Gigantopelta aegis TaxID=1735272 RepID=UPI001B88BA20|nr:axonemal 84 kDa protein-like [Gigantopelta aegis]